jgi:hypothetical protein
MLIQKTLYKGKSGNWETFCKGESGNWKLLSNRNTTSLIPKRFWQFAPKRPYF